jgi:hypothetical protein
MKRSGILRDIGTTNNPLHPLKRPAGEHNKYDRDIPTSNRNAWRTTVTGWDLIHDELMAMLEPLDHEYMKQLYIRGHLQESPENYDVLHDLGYVWEDDVGFTLTCEGEDVIALKYSELKIR